MKDLLNTALCMLDDRHITEAATYTPRAKTVSFKKILPLVACLVLVVVSVFVVKDYFTPNITQPTTSSIPAPESPYTTVAGVIDESTSVANAPPINTTTAYSTTSAEITEIRLYCTTPMKDYTGWENMPFQDFYHCIDIGGTYYYAGYHYDSSANDEPLAKEKLGTLLYEFNRSDYRFEVNGSGDFMVEIYEINGFSKDEAVAVGRKDGLMNGYYAYYRETNEE